MDMERAGLASKNANYTHHLLWLSIPDRKIPHVSWNFPQKHKSAYDRKQWLTASEQKDVGCWNISLMKFLSKLRSEPFPNREVEKEALISQQILRAEILVTRVLFVERKSLLVFLLFPWVPTIFFQFCFVPASHCRRYHHSSLTALSAFVYFCYSWRYYLF